MRVCCTHSFLLLRFVQDIVKDASASIAFLAILERLHLTRPVSWLEEHIDYMSIQALLFARDRRMPLLRQVQLFFSFRKRLSDA